MSLSPDDPASAFLIADSVIAFANSAGDLERWVIEHAEHKITQGQFAEKIRIEIANRRMEWVSEAVEVEMTGRTLGCLAEFKIPSDPNGKHRLRYAFAFRFEARRI
jgi:hypothetical protein